MLDQILATRSLLAEHDLSFLADTPVLYHCNHFNLFLDQTIDDALGTELGTRLRTVAARDAAHQLLATLNRKLALLTPPERLELATALFKAMGHGKLEILTQPSGGTARGSWLHYGFAWHEKYGAAVRRRSPADALAAGYVAAATEVAHGLPRESVHCTENHCIAMRSPNCEFTVTPGKADAPRLDVTPLQVRTHLKPSFTGQHEERIAGIAAGLRDFAGGVAGDDRGLVEAFGVLVTLHLGTYYNRISYDSWKHIHKTAPASLPVYEALLRESGHVCVFNTFGGILLSPEWEGMVGKLQGDATEIVTGCLAIGRALGFGHWTLQELVAGKRLVIKTPSTYESAYWTVREKPASQGMCFFLQGAALAIMQLQQRVAWTQSPKLTQDFYNDLFRKGVPWRVRETSCISKGDASCEVVVEAT